VIEEERILNENTSENRNKIKEKYAPNFSDADFEQFEKMNILLKKEKLPRYLQIEDFPKYASRRSMGRFLARYEIFKKVLPIHGSIVECGVYAGSGLMTWAKLSSIIEPFNHNRKIVGFDTFEGFPSVTIEDVETGTQPQLKKGGVHGASIENVFEAVKIFDANRPLSHIPKIELVKGDVCVTAEEYLKNNPHIVVSMLYLDMDIYAPTKKALEVFLPKIPKGGLICFDELNNKDYPGETIAACETVGINNLRLERTNLDPHICFTVME
jgi:hypothetical protein